MTHHWVELVERCDDSLNIFNALALCVSKLLDVLFLSRNKLVERWVKETDCYRTALKCLIKSLKVILLIRKNLLKSSFSLFNCVCANHFTECSNSVLFKEHMLCTAETDTLSTKLSCLLSISRSISICTNLKCSELVSPAHDSAECACDCSVNSRDNTIIDVTC